MTVEDAISKIESINEQVVKIGKANDEDIWPDCIYPGDIIDLLMEYRQVILEMKLAVK
jgi:hypothetical protein